MNRMCFFKIYKFQYTIGWIVYEFFLAAQFFSYLRSWFRFASAFSEWWQLTHDYGVISWMQSINFGELLLMQLTGTNPLYTETEKSSIVSVNALDRTENIHRGYYMAARGHEISLLVLKIFHEWAQRTNNIAETCFCSLHCLDKGKIYCHHGNANFSRVKVYHCLLYTSDAADE